MIRRLRLRRSLDGRSSASPRPAFCHFLLHLYLTIDLDRSIFLLPINWLGALDLIAAEIEVSYSTQTREN